MSDLPDRIRAGLEALRAGRAAEAVGLLRPVASDADLATAADLRDVRARVCSLLAQALLDAGEPAEAAAWARTARELAGEVPDVVALEGRAIAAAAARSTERDRVATTPIEALLDGVTDAARRAEIRIAKAAAELEAGRADAAVRLAEQALPAPTARAEVLARCTIASAAPDRAEAELHAAWARADRDDDVTLIGAVARTAALLGVRLGTLPDP